VRACPFSSIRASQSAESGVLKPVLVLADRITIGAITCGGYVVSAAWIVYIIWNISFQDPHKVLAARAAQEARCLHRTPFA